MPRQPRAKSSTGIYHVILRGNNKQIIFKEEEDYKTFIRLLERFKKDSDYQIYSYCLMNNHIHLLIKENSIELHKAIKQIAGTYASWYNYKYNRVGHLYQDRFRSKVVEDERYFWAVLAYIHMNPVKDNISKEMLDYRWSSFQDYMNDKGITDTNLLLKDLGETREIALKNFEELHNNAIQNSNYIDHEDEVSDELLISEIELHYGINILNLAIYSDVEIADILKRLVLIPNVNMSRLSRITGLSRLRIKKILEKNNKNS